MTSQENDVEANGHLTSTPAPGIDLGGFHWQSVDYKLNRPAEQVPPRQFRALEVESKEVVVPAAAVAAGKPKPAPLPPLGTIKAFSGTFTGRGFNLIFRPRSNTFDSFPVTPVPDANSGPPDNVLELNLTQETLAFSQQLGSVPNRGLQAQDDIFLNGVTYLQLVDDITDPTTGKANSAKAANIHAEPGVWMHVPASKVNPKLGPSLCRMASIPHGTTINAQCLDNPISIDGPPRIPIRDPRPFPIGAADKKINFDNLDVTKRNTPRIPQDLSAFAETGSITDETLRDPNSILRNHIKGQKITHSTTFTVATNPRITDLAGGVANIGFLRGDGIVVNGVNTFANPNADAVQMDAQFWIETVEATVHVPAMRAGQQPARLVPDKGPLVIVQPPASGETKAHDTKVIFTQIQYSQLVLLNFAGLSWPHVSVATLVPKEVRL